MNIGDYGYPTAELESRAKELKIIFEEFYRGAAIGDVPGSGLGLAITQKLVLLLGGTISVSSEVDLGTQFVLTFPRTFQKQPARPD